MKCNPMRALGLTAAACLAAAGLGLSHAQPASTAAASLLIRPDGAPVPGATIDARLRGRTGPVEVWVTLDQPALAARRALLTDAGRTAAPRAAASRTAAADPASVANAMRSHRTVLRSQQSGAASSLASVGAIELGRVSVAHNAIAVRIDASMLQRVAAIPGVAKVRPVVHYEMDLSETVAYIGAAKLQQTGLDGSGVRVAVLDDGIDFTHKNLSGPGTVPVYQTCYAQKDVAPSGACAALFGPKAPKVIGGFDFVGETWSPTSDTRTEDPNPIARGTHGTHVADIIAGRSADGTRKGVAPGAKIIAVKVCSAVSSSCNGIALLKAVDFALDPDGDGQIDDKADVINLSLGSSFGQVEDDLSGALANAVAAGVVVVASAGNSADRPYITGSPSITPGIISVAQTQVPSSVAIPLVVNAPSQVAGTYGNVGQVDWAPVVGTTTGDVVFVGRGCVADTPAANPAGKIALIDRGACSASEKVDKAARAGAIGVLIGLVAPGDAISFSRGDGDRFVPTLVIQQSLSNAIKARLNAGNVVNVTLSDQNPVQLVGSVVGSSSRGPSIALQLIKPEIGAPGGSVSAVAGTGDGVSAFGGTSGAAPMVAGSAALLLQAFPGRSPLQIKALLMNSAETRVFTSQSIYPGQLAPITRIGAGEVRVDRARALTGVVYDPAALSATLGFGAVEASQQLSLKRTLTLENFSNAPKQYTVASSFRYGDDENRNAVSLQTPATVTVPANGSTTFDVGMLINPNNLETWTLNAGSRGGNGQLLNAPEYDGYVTLTAGGETLSVPWQVLPRKAAAAYAAYSGSRGTNTLTLVNVGADTSTAELFPLLGSSPQLAGPLPQPGENVAVTDLRSFGARSLTPAQCGTTGSCMEFAISTYGRRSIPTYPAYFEVAIDTNGDGTPDFAVYNSEATGFAATGQPLVTVQNLATNATVANFFMDVDLNSGIAIMRITTAAIGNPAPAATLGLSVLACDNYFSFLCFDEIAGMRFTPSSPKFGLPLNAQVARGTSAKVAFTRDASTTAAQSSANGVLVLFRRNAGAESQEVVVDASARSAPAAR